MKQHIFEIGVLFLYGQFPNVAATVHSRNARISEELHFLLFNFCNNCLLDEVPKNGIFDFLTSNSCFYFFNWGLHGKYQSISRVPRRKNC